MSIQIVLVDDYAMIREGLNSLLEKQPEIEVVGEAEDGRSAIELVRELLPDIVIMDVTMPRLNGIEATRHITNELPTVKVIAFSTNCERFITQMLAAGAVGYVLKESLFYELVKAIEAVATGSRYLSPRITNIVVDDNAKRLSDAVDSSLVLLTDREREVLQLVAEGKSTKQIAPELDVSTKTIEANRRQIMDKLGLYSVAELTKYAIREGLITLKQ